jgi:hypothetical protein
MMMLTPKRKQIERGFLRAPPAGARLTCHHPQVHITQIYVTLQPSVAPLRISPSPLEITIRRHLD